MKRIWILAAVVAVFVLAVFARVMVMKAEAREVKEGVEAIQRREGYPVELVKVQKGEFAVWREVHGMLMGTRESHLRTSDPARIMSVDCKIGDEVTADTPLIRLSTDDPRNLTRVNLARRVFEDAWNDHEKFQRLAAANAINADAVAKAKLRMEAARSDLNLARSSVELVSSIDGVVTSLSARVGERADKDLDLAVVSYIDTLRFTSQISDTDAAVIKPGQPVLARTPGGGTEKGLVEKVSLRAEPKNSMFDLEISVENQSHALKIGTYTTVEVRVEFLEEELSVDYRCLATDPDGKTYIYQVKDGVAHKVEVKVVAANQDFAALAPEGLDPALPVVIRGKGLLRDGVKVLAVEPGEAQ